MAMGIYFLTNELISKTASGLISTEGHLLHRYEIQAKTQHQCCCILVALNRNLAAMSLWLTSHCLCHIFLPWCFVVHILLCCSTLKPLLKVFNWLYHTQTTVLPTQLVSGAVILQAEAVGLAHSLLSPPVLFIGTGRNDCFPAPLPAQGVRAGTEEQSEAVLLWHTL